MLKIGWNVSVIMLAGLLCASGPASGYGDIRVFFDQNGNGVVDGGYGGSELFQTGIYYSCRSTTWTGWGYDEDSTCNICGPSRAGDVFYAYRLMYSMPSPRGNRGFAGSMFDLYVDTDVVTATGALSSRTITQAEADSLNQHHFIDLPMSHPIIAWNLVVMTAENEPQDYLDKLKTGLQKASQYLFDITDGHMCLGRIDLRTGMGVSAAWKDADIQIAKATNWPWSNEFGVTGNTDSDQHICMTRLFDGEKMSEGDPDGVAYYSTIVHEIGHYCLDFYEEYEDGNHSVDNWRTYRKNNKNKVPDNYGVMDVSKTASEMSSNNDYLANYPPGTPYSDITDHIYHYYLSAGGGVHKPCWERFFEVYDNRNGTQTNWNAYGNWRIRLSMPPDGRFIGMDSSGNEVRTSADRDGPATITGDVFPYKTPQFGTGSFQSAGAGEPAAESDPTGPPRVGVGGPNLLVTAGISVSGGNRMLRVRVITDQALLFPPTVSVTPWRGNPIPVAMAQIRPMVYEGTANIATASSGNATVSAIGPGGQTEVTVPFRIVPFRANREEEVHSPDGALDARLPANALGSDALEVSIDSGDYPIPNADPTLLFITQPSSFKLQDGQAVGPVFAANWRLDPAKLLGKDSTTLSLYEFDQNALAWVNVAAASRPAFPLISASNLAEEIYAVFARVSNDLIPPGRIQNLFAQRGPAARAWC